MSKMLSWAEDECRRACKRENPTYDFDSDDFDYGCSCYKSALKAYKSLMEDEHTGASMCFTKNILMKLIDHQPLTPITDDDFFGEWNGIGHPDLNDDDYLKQRGLKSDIQCPRMSSLFRYEYLDGRIEYHDVDRSYFVDVECPSDTYSSSDRFLDEMFPITMPYMPSRKKFVIYARTFLTDKKNGDFDTKGILYVITPEDKRVDLNIYRHEINGKMTDITKEEYDELLKKRIDPLNKKVSGHLIWTVLENSTDDQQRDIRSLAWSKIPEDEKKKMYDDLDRMCMFFDHPDHYQYNTFHNIQAMARGDEEDYKDVPELVEIGNYLQSIIIRLSKVEFTEEELKKCRK